MDKWAIPVDYRLHLSLNTSAISATYPHIHMLLQKDPFDFFGGFRVHFGHTRFIESKCNKPRVPQPYYVIAKFSNECANTVL